MAGGLMILAGLSVVGLALAVPAGSSITADSQTIGGVVVGILLIGAGVEAIRRRHYRLALSAPIILAVLSAGYGIATGQAMVIATVLLYAVVALLIAVSRPAFVGGSEVVG